MIEKNNLFSILSEWNHWKKEFNHLRSRPLYTDEIKRLIRSNEIIVVSGVRRCGKSSIFHLTIKDLLKNIDVDNTLFVNLEDSRFLEDLNLTLLDDIYSTYKDFVNPKGDIYLFLDEIQNIPHWEKWVRTRYELDDSLHILITGSSSKLLSGELATVLTGRYLEVTVHPLNFNEFLLFKNTNISSKKDMIFNKLDLQRLFREYATYGGFPKVISLENDLKNDELNSYFQSILYKDIVARHKVKHPEQLLKLAHFVITNSAKILSINNMRKMLKMSFETTKNYIEYFKETYLIFEVPKFSYSLKKQLGELNKYYCIDTGLANAVSFRFSKDSGRMLENIIFLELKKRYQHIYYHKEKYECDFIIKEKETISQAIQVTQYLTEENRKRELKGLVEAIENYSLKEGTIVTLDTEESFEYEGHQITCVPVWKWLLEKSILKPKEEKE